MSAYSLQRPLPACPTASSLDSIHSVVTARKSPPGKSIRVYPSGAWAPLVTKRPWKYTSLLVVEPDVDGLFVHSIGQDGGIAAHLEEICPDGGKIGILVYHIGVSKEAEIIQMELVGNDFGLVHSNLQVKNFVGPRRSRKMPLSPDRKA